MLGEILGQVPGVAFSGEVRRVWTKVIDENALCGCGERLLSCKVWARVIEEAFGGPEKARELRDAVLEGRPGPQHFPQMALGESMAKHAIPDVRLDALEALYDAIADVTDADLIVDTGKFPLYGRQLELLPEVDLSVVNLVRDPRGVAYSAQKVKRQPDPDHERYMRRFSIREVAGRWLARHLTSLALWARKDHHISIRYEDLAQTPLETVRRILDMVGMEGAEDPFVDEATVQFGETHPAWGNPIRMKEEEVPIRLDEAWRENLPASDRRLVTALTFPELLRHGYPLRV